MDQWKKESLLWFVDFANMDLQRIDPLEKSQFIEDARAHIFPASDLYQFDPVFAPGRSSKRLRALVRRMMPWIPGNWPAEGSPAYWRMVLRLQRVVKQVLSALSGIGGGFIVPGALKVSVKLDIGGEAPFRVSYFPSTKSHAEYIRCKLILRVIDGLPVKIRQCPGCQSLFLNFTEKRKAYCSLKCNWRSKSRQRREADPEGYRRRQREIMWRTYPKRKAESTGFKNVKVARRKRKADYL